MKVLFFAVHIFIFTNALCQRTIDLKENQLITLDYSGSYSKEDTAKIIFSFQDNDTLKMFFLEPIECINCDKKQNITTINEIAKLTPLVSIFSLKFDNNFYRCSYKYFTLTENTYPNNFVKKIHKKENGFIQIELFDTVDFEKVNDWVLVKE